MRARSVQLILGRAITGHSGVLADPQPALVSELVVLRPMRRRWEEMYAAEIRTR